AVRASEERLHGNILPGHNPMNGFDSPHVPVLNPIRPHPATLEFPLVPALNIDHHPHLGQKALQLLAREQGEVRIIGAQTQPTNTHHDETPAPVINLHKTTPDMTNGQSPPRKTHYQQPVT